MVREINQKAEENTFWDEEITVFELDKSKKSYIRFSLCKKEEKEYISVREFVCNKEGEYIPTKKGMTIARENLKEFIECLNRI